MVFAKCCCCIDLRVGAIIIAILDILGGLGNFSGSWPNYLIGVASVAAGVCLLFGAIKYNQIATIIHLVLAMLSFVLYVVGAILAIVLGGVAASSTTSTIDGLNTGQTDLNNAVTGVAVGVTVVVAVLLIIIALIMLYFWFCVFSFYKGLKSGSIASPTLQPVTA